MSNIYLIRHAQAGSRDNYDVLSDLGERQALLLGEYIRSQEMSLGAVFSGSMQRQRRTAEIACSIVESSALQSPDLVIDDRLNEFNLASVYRAIAKRLIEESEEFACDFKEMQEVLRKDPHTTRGATGRCDAAVIRAWISDRFPDYGGETWRQFRERIQTCFSCLTSENGDRSIAIFTSATPIALLTGVALGLDEEKMLSILGVIYNASITTIRIKDGSARLFTFNETPHLPLRLRTFR
ncbi:MAG TPA: histidine phosphatase family protein [Blastocatellia bacterium]|nr:histidine phosphatase family protein [Blastocatellia bacterium]